MNHWDYLTQPEVLKGLVVAIVVSMAVCMLWYSPKVFGDMWMKLAGVKAKNIDKMRAYIGSVLSHLLVAGVMACFMQKLGVQGYDAGVLLGLKLWLGFNMPFAVAGVLWADQPVKLFAINSGCNLLQLMATGAVLSHFL